MAIGLALGLAIATSTILSMVVQSLLVQPNELARETPYIQCTIEMTRKAFGLEKIDAQTFNPQDNLTEQTIQANDRTIWNIRLWDQQPLLATNRQLQQIRLYYRFPDADIDRYLLASEPSTAPKISSLTSTNEQSLLYVEPLYLEATQNKLPTLIRVIVAYENRIVMAKTLQLALSAIFKASPTPAPPLIVRPVAEPLQSQ